MEMEKKMERKFIMENIPVWEWEGISLVRIGKDDFITAEPVAKNVRGLSQARKIATDFGKEKSCHTTVADETEWLKLIEFLEKNYATKEFLEEHDLDNKEVLLLDSMSEGETHVLAAGRMHRLNEIFRGFISGDDADGEPQPKKVLFLTIKNLIE